MDKVWSGLIIIIIIIIIVFVVVMVMVMVMLMLMVMVMVMVIIIVIPGALRHPKGQTSRRIPPKVELNYCFKLYRRRPQTTWLW